MLAMDVADNNRRLRKIFIYEYDVWRTPGSVGPS